MWPQLKNVNGYWDKADYWVFFSCPQCGLSFTARSFWRRIQCRLICIGKPLLYDNPVQMRMESVQWMWFLHFEEAEGCDWGAWPHAGPIWVCSFQMAHAGGNFCIPARKKLYQTWQDVGSVVFQRWPVHLPALCNSWAQRSWHCLSCSRKERQTKKDDLLLPRIRASECAIATLTTIGDLIHFFLKWHFVLGLTNLYQCYNTCHLKDFKIEHFLLRNMRIFGKKKQTYQKRRSSFNK